jgi:hypothetical protein
MILAQMPRRRRPVPLPAGVAPARARPQSSGNIDALAALVNGSPLNHWIDTNIKPGTNWAIRSMIPGVQDAIMVQLGGLLQGEAQANFTVGAYDTLLNSNGAAYFPLRKQIFFSGGGHGGWPGNEVYGVDLESMSMWRQTDPSPMKRNPDGQMVNGVWTFAPSWSTLDGTLKSTHTYNGICAIEALDSFFVLSGSPWPEGNSFNQLWKFNIETSVWTFIANEPMGRTGIPNAVWVESEQKIAIGHPQWWRWFDPFNNTFGPVQNSFQAGDRGYNGMSVHNGVGIYSISHSAIDYVPFTGIGTVRPVNVVPDYPQFEAYEHWDRVMQGWNSYLWDFSRNMLISWSGGTTKPEPGKRMWAIDFVNGKLYEFPLTGTWPDGSDCLGAFTKFIHITELDCYLCLNNVAEDNGWMVVRPGPMNLVAG